MKILFHVFGIPISFLGTMIAVGILLGILVAQSEIKRKGLNVDRFLDIVLYSIISAIVGARLVYIVFYNFSYYLKNPIDIFKITEGGLSIHGALIGAFIFGFLYIRKHKLSFFKYADAMAPGIILGQGIGRVGCDVFGKAMATPFFWGVQRQGQLLHPAQVYEFLLDYLVFFILWRKRKSIKYDGQIFVWYVILFAINRGIVELFRINPSVIGWFSISHLLSVFFIIGALALMYLAKNKANNALKFINARQASTKSEVIRDIIGIVLLIAISLVIFYGLQG